MESQLLISEAVNVVYLTWPDLTITEASRRNDSMTCCIGSLSAPNGYATLLRTVYAQINPRVSPLTKNNMQSRRILRDILLTRTRKI